MPVEDIEEKTRRNKVCKIIEPHDIQTDGSTFITNSTPYFFPGVIVIIISETISYSSHPDLELEVASSPRRRMGIEHRAALEPVAIFDGWQHCFF